MVGGRYWDDSEAAVAAFDQLAVRRAEELAGRCGCRRLGVHRGVARAQIERTDTGTPLIGDVASPHPEEA